ncbi:MAG: hypothetical protein HOP10_09295 [Chitinophagaceae bacterium]|nr:hypothetical protein [Chitinophagaceae bacterium]
MKLIITILSIFLTTTSYSQLEFYECPIKKSKEYIKDASLTMNITVSGKDTTFYGWKADTGSFTVFKYENLYSCDKSFHEATYAVLIWAIPDNETSFEINFDSIDSLRFPLLYKTSCGPPCRRYNFDLIAGNGILKGQLKDKKWEIDGMIKLVLKNRNKDIIVSKEISFNDEFVLWKQKGRDKKGHKFNGF